MSMKVVKPDDDGLGEMKTLTGSKISASKIDGRLEIIRQGSTCDPFQNQARLWTVVEFNHLDKIWMRRDLKKGFELGPVIVKPVCLEDLYGNLPAGIVPFGPFTRPDRSLTTFHNLCD